jgi:hypothetical protein
MGDRRALDAISRIERALSRIETAARRPEPAGNGDELAQVIDAHEKLRSRVAVAILEIDRMLEIGGR